MTFDLKTNYYEQQYISYLCIRPNKRLIRINLKLCTQWPLTLKDFLQHFFGPKNISSLCPSPSPNKLLMQMYVKFALNDLWPQNYFLDKIVLVLKTVLKNVVSYIRKFLFNMTIFCLHKRLFLNVCKFMQIYERGGCCHSRR
jgi:hypothetical protein